MEQRTYDAIAGVLYNAKRVSNPDAALKRAGAAAGRVFSHRALRDLSEVAAQKLLAFLEREYPDRTADVRQAMRRTAS